jgi:large subunit ribosomal protein L25
MSAAMHNVTALPRTETGKGAIRRLRHAGKVPAIAYGKDLAATSLAVEPKDILTVLKSERGQNTVIQMKVDGMKDLLVMIKEYTYHPVTRSLEHVDFVEVKLDRPVDVDVPLIALGKPKGVVTGGILRQVYRTIPIRALPDRIPLKLEASVEHLELGDHVATKDLKLPAGVDVRLPPEQTLLAVVAPEKEKEEDIVSTSAAAVPGAPGAAPGAAGAAPGAAGAAPGAGGAPGAAGAAAPGAGAGAAKDAGKDAKKK